MIGLPMVGSWLIGNPGKALTLVLIGVLLAALGVRTVQLWSLESRLAVAIAERAQAQAAALACSESVALLEQAGHKRAQEAAKAIAIARVATATRQPQIEALRAAELAPGPGPGLPPLACNDAVGAIRDSLR